MCSNKMAAHQIILIFMRQSQSIKLLYYIFYKNIRPIHTCTSKYESKSSWKAVFISKTGVLLVLFPKSRVKQPF